MRLNSKGPYLSSEKGKRKLSYVQVLQKTDMKERSVKSWIVSKVINKKRNLCSCKVVSFAFLPFSLPSVLSLLTLPVYRFASTGRY